MMKRKKIYEQMEDLMVTYCHGCLLYKHHKEEKGRTFAHRFCITKCTVGEQIKQIGSKLTQS